MSGLAGAGIDDAAGEAGVEYQQQVAGNLLEDVEESVTRDHNAPHSLIDKFNNVYNIYCLLPCLLYIHTAEWLAGLTNPGTRHNYHRKNISQVCS